MLSDYERLSSLLTSLRSLGYDVPTGLPYRAVRDRACEGRFPAKMIGQVWHYNRNDTPIIAEALGCVAPATRTAA
jgi:hypothetical protein